MKISGGVTRAGRLEKPKYEMTDAKRCSNIGTRKAFAGCDTFQGAVTERFIRFSRYVHFPAWRRLLEEGKIVNAAG